MRLNEILDEDNLDKMIDEDSTHIIGHVKLKGETYKALHYIMTGLSGRKIWEMMLAKFIKDNNVTQVPKGVNYDEMMKLDTSKGVLEMLGDVPDEFATWVNQIMTDINLEVSSSVWQDLNDSARLSLVPEGRERFEAGKDLAHIAHILRHIKTGDPTGIHLAAWTDARPGVELPFRKDEQ